jgi:NTE family protein
MHLPRMNTFEAVHRTLRALRRVWPIPLCALGILTACSDETHYPINPVAASPEVSEGYRVQRVKDDPDNPGDVFVILTFSGGGTRAASLAYGTLEALRDVTLPIGGRPRRLLDEVDIINAVSGGSIVAAYYGLHRDRIFQDFESRFLRRDVESEIKKELASNLLRLASPRFGRGDLLAEYFDREIFDRKTFADLARGSLRPFVVINAADLSTGARFPFTQGQFDLLCSDLSPVPVGRAVAASFRCRASRPVLFNRQRRTRRRGCTRHAPTSIARGVHTCTWSMAG